MYACCVKKAVCIINYFPCEIFVEKLDRCHDFSQNQINGERNGERESRIIDVSFSVFLQTMFCSQQVSEAASDGFED